MTNDFNPIVKLYYEELFGNLEFYLSDIVPGFDPHRELEPIGLKRQGLSMAEEVTRDQYPQLGDLFEQTSVTERYNYLLDRFANEYRSMTDKELAGLLDEAEESLNLLDAHSMAAPSSWDKIKSEGTAERDWKDKMDTLERRYQEDSKRCGDFQKYFLSEPALSCDADAYARGEIETYFPALDKAYLDFKDKEIDVFVEIDPEAIYESILASYSTEFVARIGSELKVSLDDYDTSRRSLERHDKEKPDLLASVASFGDAVEKWESRRAVIVDELEHCAGFVEKYASIRSQLVENGASSQLAIESAEKVVQSVHPNVFEAKIVLMARREIAQQQEQENALGRQGEIGQDEGGQTQENSAGLKR